MSLKNVPTNVFLLQKKMYWTTEKFSKSNETWVFCVFCPINSIGRVIRFERSKTQQKELNQTLNPTFIKQKNECNSYLRTTILKYCL